MEWQKAIWIFQIRATHKNVPSIFRYGFGVRLHIESLRPPMLLLSRKAGPHLWSYRGRAYNVWRCVIPIGVVGLPCVCHIVVPCMGGAHSPPPKTEQHCLVLLTNWDACASSKLMSRVLWVQQHYTSRLTVREAYCWVLVPCMRTETISDGFPPCRQLSVQWEKRIMVKLFTVG